MKKLDLILAFILILFIIVLIVQVLDKPITPSEKATMLYLYDRADVIEQGHDYILLEFNSNKITKEDSIKIQKYIYLLKFYKEETIFINFFNNYNNE